YEMEFLPENYYAVVIVQEWISKKILQAQEIAIGTVDNDEEVAQPVSYILQQNYPNPFNPSTTISYNLINESSNNAVINIYNMKGQLIKQFSENQLSVGENQVVWYGKDNKGNSVSSGIYFYNLKVGNSVIDAKQMVLIK
ncbi:MAG: FlgD immunoglobulin-like domain containing protein, partial [Candidatus Cloacimonadota bacterium]|nr:FlgD immunoglobulin-like domain containing protein [Candidatus Cloacimonadota bacterium]